MKTGTGSLVLISITVIVVHVLVLGAVANSETGRSPFTAVPLRDGKNTGVLAPGQAQWYKYVRTGDDGALQRQLDLTLIFTPDDGHRIHRINFQVFRPDQTGRWYWGDVSQMPSMGVAGIVSRDDNPLTGELLWSGWVVDNDAYYIQVSNDADVSIDYGLFTDNVIAAKLGESSALPPAAGVLAGADPNHPLALAPDLQKGQLAAGQEIWYAVVFDDDDREGYEAHTFTLIFTPNDGHRIHRVGFEIIPLDQMRIWQRGDTDQLRDVIAGSVVSRDEDPLTGERSWSGWLMDGETYYIRVRNDAEVAIDYWFFADDVIHPEWGDLVAP